MQEFVKIESLLVIIVYTTNQDLIIPSNFNNKEFTCLTQTIHQINGK